VISAPIAARSAPSPRVVAALECLAVLGLMYGVRAIARAAGVTVGVGPVGIVLALALATWLLARRGVGWRSLGFTRPPDLARAAAWTVGMVLTCSLVLPLLLQAIASALHFPPQNFTRFGNIRGNTLRYLSFLIPLGWGTAAFGEELVYRGFLNTRLSTALGGTPAAEALAGVAQAALFGSAHAYLGPTGVMNATAIGLVAAAVYAADGRNLWPLIVAHGLVDTVGITVLYLGLAHHA
jgi:CAAX protease family protein